MHVKRKGHVYQLRDKDWDVKETQTLTFSDRENDAQGHGVTTQEVLRVLIDRTRYCNNCLPHPNNERIIYHLRMALVLHEARALERAVEKGELIPEHAAAGHQGHFIVDGGAVGRNLAGDGELTPELKPYRPDWERVCDYPPPAKKK